ncbi:cytochrome P450 [Colletotrichum plurivorum]|uniref:Cytochrome P450 n=1 Tax=Colletotrichum plurivorum TaxID=2175906 RepID=A0A8H6JND9_9PEZI|nr:cytochrome P450 [Colletotrichum plurivorum]
MTPLTLGLLIAALVAVVYRRRRRILERDFPVVNKLPSEYYRDAEGLVSKGFEEHGGRPFRVDSGLAKWIILPGETADEIRNHEDLDSTKKSQAALPGFEPFAIFSSQLMHDITKCITRNLGKEAPLTCSPSGADDGWTATINEPLSSETTFAMRDVLTDETEWHEILLRPTVTRIIARVTSLIFVGPELCCDPTWLDVTASYFAKSNAAGKELRHWPAFLRPLVNMAAPRNRELRTLVATARQSINRVLQSREAAKRLTPGAATVVPQYHDVLTWSEDLAVKKGLVFDPAVLQLSLYFTSMHTSGDMITQALLDLCCYPELVGPLREEMRNVLGPGCWSKSKTMNDLKLLDSVLKESQRLKPVSIISMGRTTKKDVFLKDGTVLPKGNIIATSCRLMWDPIMYKDPMAFDGYRFLRRRECDDPSKKHTATLVATSPDHLGFGHGQYACPGRFFGVNEVKIILCHLLSNYDLKLAENSPTEPVHWGFEMLANPQAIILVRRRQEQIVEF